jgi:hypothetical protein
MKYCVARIADGSGFIVPNIAYNAAGDLFEDMVENAYNAAETPFLIFTDTVDTGPPTGVPSAPAVAPINDRIFYATDDRTFIVT